MYNLNSIFKANSRFFDLVHRFIVYLLSNMFGAQQNTFKKRNKMYIKFLFQRLSPVIVSALFFLSCVGVMAMQNPVYNGMNRIELQCPTEPEVPVTFCRQFAEELEKRFRIRVEMRGESKISNLLKKGERPFGVLNVDLELNRNAGEMRVRIVLTNGNDNSKFEGSWVNFYQESPGATVPNKFISQLIDTAP